MDDHPINHLADRFRKLSRNLSESADGVAAWVGLVAVFREPDREPATGVASISKWLRERGSPAGHDDLAAFQFMQGVNREAWFEGITVQGYETHFLSQVTQPLISVAELSKAPITETGIEFVVDLNSKPANKPERVGTIVMEVLRRMEARYAIIIDEVPSAMGGKRSAS
jgi:hypothetical protein